MCKHGPRGMAVTYRSRKRMVPYRTRLTGRLISCNEGFDADRIEPLTILAAALRHDLLQRLHQSLGRRHVRRMTRIELEIAPALLVPRALRELPEHIARRNALAIDVA